MVKMVSLRALRPFPYGKHRLVVGEVFDVPEILAAVFIKEKRAGPVESPSPVDLPADVMSRASKGVTAQPYPPLYQTRHMEAATPKLEKMGRAPAEKAWPPRWHGQEVAIVASGPSAKHAQLALLKDRCRVIAIKQSHDLVPFADAVYGCDAPWWTYRNGLPEFKGHKVCYVKNGLNGFPDIHRIAIPDTKCDKLLSETGKTGSGGNSGFQALNLAIQWGAKRVLLIGFDMTDAPGKLHWYGHNQWRSANNPDKGNFKRWISAFGNAATQCRELGVEVVNCSSVSVLTCFPKMTIEEALQ